MTKKATTSVEINELLANRWSPRAFADEMVSAETLTALFEAARWAASANNNQPWRFLVSTKQNAAAHQQYVECLNPGNQTWAAQAPVLAFIVAKTMIAARGSKPARQNVTAFYEVGLAVAQLTVEATARGLYVHQMGGINRDKVVDTFNIPEGFGVVAGMAIGQLGDGSLLPDDLQERESAERTRKPLNNIVFGDSWDESYF